MIKKLTCFFTLIFFFVIGNTAFAQSNPSIPIDFESLTLTYTWTDFAGGVATVIDNPQSSGINTSSKVAQMIKYAGENYGGSSLALGSTVDFAGNNANAIKMKVYANRIGAKVTFKLEGNSTTPHEVTVPTTVANQWEELTFSFAGFTSPAYNTITIIYELGTVGDGSADFTLLFDDIEYTTAAAGGVQIPIDFESNTLTYTWSDFAGGVATIIDNPQSSGINTSAKVGQMIKYAGENYGGSTLALGAPVDFGSNNAIKMKVFANRVGAGVTFKLEGAVPHEVTVPTTVANQWQELTFDFTGFTNATYSGITIIYDLGVVGDGSADFTLLFDDIEYTTTSGSLTPPSLPIDFESTTTDYTFTDFDGGAATVITNPDQSGINTSGHVAKMVKSAGQVWGGSYLLLASPIDFSTNKTFKVKAWMPEVGRKFLLKVENASNGAIYHEVEATGTVAQQWEELTFDFSGVDVNQSYQKLTFIFDNGTMGDGTTNFTYYFDDVELVAGAPVGTQMNLPVTFDDPTVNYGLVGFGGAENSTIVPDPTLPSNNVAKVVKSAGAETWAGTTVTAVVGNVQTGFSSKIPFTASETKMNVRVWSPDANIPVRLKVEDYTDPTKSVETEVLTTVASAWETLTFDFTVPTNPPTAALNLSYNYNKASIFFNFGTSGAIAGEKTYYFDDLKFGDGTTSVEEIKGTVPTAYELGQNYPNPFNPSTTINFSLPESGNVKLQVYDITGRLVKEIVKGEMAAGTYSVNFDASNLASGTYIYRIEAGNFVQSKAMLLLK